MVELLNVGGGGAWWRFVVDIGGLGDDGWWWSRWMWVVEVGGCGDGG